MHPSPKNQREYFHHNQEILLIQNLWQTVNLYEDGLKSSYDVISAVDDFLTRSKHCNSDRRNGGLCWKMNLIWLHSMRVSWSVYELFSWTLNIKLWCYFVVWNQSKSQKFLYLDDVNSTKQSVRKLNLNQLNFA